MKIRVKVTFGNETRLLGWFGDCIKIRLSAKPEKGKANKELIKYLSKELGIPKSMIVIKSGQKTRNKIVELPNEAYEILLGMIE